MTHRELVAHALDLVPIMRTGSALECGGCHNAILPDHVYFVEYTNPDQSHPWCRHCGVSLLLALHIIDDETAAAIPVVGPIPLWLQATSALSWKFPEQAFPI